MGITFSALSINSKVFFLFSMSLLVLTNSCLNLVLGTGTHFVLKSSETHIFQCRLWWLVRSLVTVSTRVTGGGARAGQRPGDCVTPGQAHQAHQDHQDHRCHLRSGSGPGSLLVSLWCSVCRAALALGLTDWQWPVSCLLSLCWASLTATGSHHCHSPLWTPHSSGQAGLHSAMSASAACPPSAAFSGQPGPAFPVLAEAGGL